MTTPFVLCADDYGIAPGVSRAILDLVERNRISATDCMTVSPFWPEHAAWLRPYAERIDIGLHLTLTDQRPLGPMPKLAPRGRLPPLARLLHQSYTGGLDAAEIAEEIDRQLAAFEAHFGRPPVFVDGHQHIHQLPVIREALVRSLAGSGVYVRLCIEPATRIVRRGIAVPKTLLIAHLGRGLHRLLLRHRLRHNHGFSGVYGFAVQPPFGALFERFVREIRPGGLVMCHPGIPDEALRAADPVTDARRSEYDWLGGPEFRDILASRHLRLARLADCGL